MDYERINTLIRRSLLEIFYQDAPLLNRRVREECINHRLAYYFETLFSGIIHDDMYYNVDLEYNKNLSQNNKDISIDNNTVMSIRPDVIIHQRDDNNNNLLAVEAKLFYLNRHDFVKLKKLLLPPYNYRFTAGICYNPEKPYFTYRIFRLVDGNIENILINVEKQ